MADRHETDVVVTDVVVIGAGPVGENLAQYAIEGGLSVVMVESGLVGGECSYHACMPSKALLRPVEVAHTASHLRGVQPTSVDADAMMRRRDYWTSHQDDSGQVAWAQGIGIELVRGHARLAGDKLVEVTASDGTVRLYEARVAVVLATGSVPIVPDVFATANPWLSPDATGVVEVPERLAIAGGGVVAVEAATWLAAMGSRVTLLVRGEKLLASQEPFAGEAVEKALLAAGVDVRHGVTVDAVERTDVREAALGHLHGGPVTLSLGGQTLVVDEVLVAAGRRPNLDDVGLDRLGLTPDDVVSGRLPQWLHVIGDAGTGAPLTHMGKYEARVLGSRLAGVSEHPAVPEVPVPQVVFTDPQVASVGLTEQVARQQGRDVVVSYVDWNSAAGASLLRDDAGGGAKLVVERATGHLLGATFVGPDAGELLHAATIAIVGQVPVSVLRHAVPSYPTASELWLRLLEQLPHQMR